MEAERDYFMIEGEGLIVGRCDCFMAEEEKTWRDEERYEKMPYQRVAKYTRNVRYTPLNTRTQEALKDCLSYLFETLFSLLLSQKSANQKYALAVFLQERVKAIRCEYFVQGIINPKQLLKIIKANLLIDMYKGEGERKTGQMVGLQHLISQQNQSVMLESYLEQYRQALTIAILTTNKQGLQKLLQQHQTVMETPRLIKVLRVRLEIQSGNYQLYYRTLENEQPLVRCLLWKNIEDVKAHFLCIVKKSFFQLPVNWILKRLCLKQEESDRWVKVKELDGPLKREKQGFKAWLPEDCLLALVQ